MNIMHHKNAKKKKKKRRIEDILRDIYIIEKGMEWKGKVKRNAQQSKYGMHNSGKEITVNKELSTNSIPLILLYNGTI